MKVCFKCEKAKPLSEFYRHSGMSDGHLNKCKECTKEDVHRNRLANLDKYREYDRIRGSRQTAEYLQKWREENPQKYAAHNAVNNAVRDGRLIKPDFPCPVELTQLWTRLTFPIAPDWTSCTAVDLPSPL